MVDGENYIRGLSDNELERFTGLNRDMYTKQELQIADDELTRRKKARAAKAAASAPAAPRQNEKPAAPAERKPDIRVISDNIPTAAAPPIERQAESKRPAEVEAPQEPEGAFMYCTNCGSKCRLDADYCPDCGNRVSLQDEPEPYPPLRTDDVGETRARGSACDSMDNSSDNCCYGYGRWRCCGTDI